MSKDVSRISETTSGQSNLVKRSIASTQSLHSTMNRHAFPLKSAPSRGGSEPPHLTHGSQGSHQSAPKWHLDRFSRFEQFTRVPNTQTCRPRYVYTQALRPKKTSTSLINLFAIITSTCILLHCILLNSGPELRGAHPIHCLIEQDSHKSGGPDLTISATRHA